MKKLFYVRHSLKEGDVISAEGLVKAKELGMRFSETVTDLFHGILVRTAQTLIAVMTGMGKFCENTTLHPVIEEIGTQDLFDEMVTPAFKEARKTASSNLEALMMENIEVSNFPFFLHNSGAGVEKMFSMMSDGGVGLAIGHDPIISLATEHFGLKLNGYQMKELEYIIFTEENGKITAEFGWDN